MLRAFQPEIPKKWMTAVAMLELPTGNCEYTLYQAPSDTAEILRAFIAINPQYVKGESLMNTDLTFLEEYPLFVSSVPSGGLIGSIVNIPVLKIIGDWVLIYSDWSCTETGWLDTRWKCESGKRSGSKGIVKLWSKRSNLDATFFTLFYTDSPQDIYDKNSETIVGTITNKNYRLSLEEFTQKYTCMPIRYSIDSEDRKWIYFHEINGSEVSYKIKQSSNLYRANWFGYFFNYEEYEPSPYE